MRTGAQVVKAVPRRHGMFDPIHDLRNSAIKDIDHFLALVADLFGGVTGGNVKDKRRQLVTGKIRTDLLIGDRRTGYGKLWALCGARQAVDSLGGCDKEIYTNMQRRSNLRQGAKGRRGIPAFDLTKVANRHTRISAQLL